jgi:hypothetical protein
MNVCSLHGKTLNSARSFFSLDTHAHIHRSTDTHAHKNERCTHAKKERARERKREHKTACDQQELLSLAPKVETRKHKKTDNKNGKQTHHRRRTRPHRGCPGAAFPRTGNGQTGLVQGAGQRPARRSHRKVARDVPVSWQLQTIKIKESTCENLRDPRVPQMRCLLGQSFVCVCVCVCVWCVCVREMYYMCVKRRRQGATEKERQRQRESGRPKGSAIVCARLGSARACARVCLYAGAGMGCVLFCACVCVRACV